MIKKKYLIAIILFFNAVGLNAQIKNFNAGFNLGLGEIKGNTASVTSFGGTLFFDFKLWFSDEVNFRTGFFYARKVEYFIPENRQGRYYPFIKSFLLKSQIQQSLYNYFFIEEGLGLIYLNDRTLSDTNNWQPGISFNLTSGIKFSKMSLGLGIDYGMGITKTNASYYIIYLQGKMNL